MGIEKVPGKNVAYVVTDDEKTSRERVRLIDERPQAGEYDIEFYQQRTIRAAESVLAPFGWRRGDIESYLSDHEDASITTY
ncbi:hypothetical protein [Halococcus sp. IIIV-5B]|uniref:hypothetical protein n=1 Tax=Halococcus sp. IIIV-5B TaxID=2321230 RepID=UPI0011C46E86|nr:hypothetical protein [Halococcus sp. IIIV-5B]